MKVIQTEFDGVLIVEPDVYKDERGYFFELWNAERYVSESIGVEFVQDNVSFSQKGVLRGLHFQNPEPQGKLVTALMGEVYDVVVDIQLGSPTYGQWLSVVLSSENHRQLYVPEGFAHGFLVLSDEALVNYKCTGLYRKGAEHSIRWDDPALDIEWPADRPILSKKDEEAPFLRHVPEAHLFRLENI